MIISSTGILMMSKDRVEVVLQIHHQKYDIRVYVCEINNNFLLNSVYESASLLSTKTLELNSSWRQTKSENYGKNWKNNVTKEIT